MKHTKMWLKTLFNIVKVMMILAFLFPTSKPLEAARALDDMKSKPESQEPAQIPPSAPNPCTYIPESDDGGLQLNKKIPEL